MIKKLIDLAEKGILPDFLIRSGIRRMQKERLLWEKSRSVSEKSINFLIIVNSNSLFEYFYFLVLPLQAVHRQ